MSPLLFKCDSCKWSMGNYTCYAYPKDIPNEIYFNLKEHDKVLPDQEGDFIYEKS